MLGHLIAFEGLDQSGKQTQAERLRDRLKQDGRKARLVSFPDYGTSIGEEIARALQGEREYGADVMQLLYVANRYERKPDLLRWLEGGLMLVCDRYTASSVAYGEAFGLDPAWLADMQKFLPPACDDHLSRHCAGDRHRSGRLSTATATNATSRCRLASARVISARRPSRAGSCLTASAPRTPLPRTCSARWPHDSSRCSRPHLAAPPSSIRRARTPRASHPSC